MGVQGQPPVGPALDRMQLALHAVQIELTIANQYQQQQ
jgi:hypothetical protein